MRKIALLVVGLLLSFSAANAQDTLIFEDFNDTIVGTTGYNYQELYPNAILNDTNWYNYDEDQIPDASGSSRPDAWYLVGGGFVYPDTNDICLMSNSWTNDGVNPVANWLILPAIQITNGPTAWIKWKAAPRQTPYYLDGYEIRISTINNDLPSFTDVVYTAAEYTSGDASGSNNYANYVFSTPGFVHGLDGSYVDCAACTSATDSARQIGIQRPDSVSLAAYDNMKIYIAFKHTSHDDNLISIDDILVTEQIDPTFSVETLSDFAASVYPNPAAEFVNVSFDVSKYHNATVQMLNNSGQVIYSSVLTTVNHRIELQGIAPGAYFVKIQADEGNLVKKIIVSK